MKRKESTRLTLAALIIAIFVVANAIFIFIVIGRIENDSKIINYSGIVRGSIQRIAKMELSGTRSDSYINQVNRIFAMFEKREEGFYLFFENDRYRQLDLKLKNEWELLQKAIDEFRDNDTEDNRMAIVSISERCWVIANDLVFEAQDISQVKLNFFRYVFIIIGFNIIAVFVIIYLIKKYVKDKLEYLASYDQLTKVLNRHSYSVILNQEMNRTNRYQTPLSLVIIDIDDFKLVNDRFGHNNGDYVLKALAEIISNCLRSSDALFRIGGEEFVVLTSNTDKNQAVILLEKIRSSIYTHSFKSVGTVSVSIGIAEYKKNESEAELFRRADSALYLAKKSGKNCLKIAS